MLLDDEDLSRGISRDMSPEAIARRLDIASQLFKLWNTLRNAKYVGPVERVEDDRPGPTED